ncbi:MAG: UDP-N-acetylglucosamine 2-epimerase (non-hydrolyzing) [Candidatus Eisenbacteria bacterium]|uniref:UDP-N-acetylglucosamine 2-epimerase (Non-hydrolyzing) n=1 Tax=Eiseniibacteriota bacterium TaxID=2212470 RepID=A0A938BRZ5_UNCEI|nr:UDP-N-acetylglucosamine 2-epimerase (non-hydrolyzing) [Candidatus Eisenbacteria bacterium]
MAETSTALIHCIAGARPNFVKIGPIMRALSAREGLAARLINTGQHYDAQMSRAFFEDLALPEPDRHLEVGSGSHGAQTARVLERYEQVLAEERPALTLVVGDVNSTLACALAAAKAGVAVAHVEAGLRSFDRGMPEEINRLLTDQLADYLFITCRDAGDNLLREGIAAEKIHFVGNVMIDALVESLPLAARRAAPARFGLTGRAYAVATIHRPSNVDTAEGFTRVLEILAGTGARLPVVFPLHPRTEKRAAELGLEARLRGLPGVILTPPLRYLEFLDLLRQARLVLTDSGGLQEETSVLGIPCLTLRANTERPVTISQGTNRLAGTDPAVVLQAAGEVLDAPPPASPPVIELWDGRAAPRIAEALALALID